jgi:hypothetical protein
MAEWAIFIGHIWKKRGKARLYKYNMPEHFCPTKNAATEEAWMQKSATQETALVLAPDPTYKIIRYRWIIVGMVFALAIGGSLFLPEPLRDELIWNNTTPLLHYISANGLFAFIAGVLILSIFITPFINIWGFSSWRRFERDRQRVVQNHFSGIIMASLSLPEISTPLPTSLSLSLRRNWRVVRIAAPIYALVSGFFLWDYAVGWQMNIQHLAQQGALSGWALPGGIIAALPVCLLCLPATIAIILGPRQHLMATQDGLICQLGLRFSSLSWSEAKLFAVTAESQGTFVYELASSTSVIRWSSKVTLRRNVFPAAVMGIASLGLAQAAATNEEYQWQTRLLTAMVAARTNLPLYDLRQS